MARVLIVAGGCPGRMLAAELVRDGHAVRVTTRAQERRAQIEETGAECLLADPARAGTLRQALEGVTIACWLLGRAHGSPAALRALHTRLLERFLHQLIDTTVRGFVYEVPRGEQGVGVVGGRIETAGEELPPGGEAGERLADGEAIARAAAARNSIPLAVVRTEDAAGLARELRRAIDGLLGVRPADQGRAARGR